MQNMNYQKELDSILASPDNYKKKLLLHCCCAPCSSYVLTYLSSFFDITVYFYNPNITNAAEYEHRFLELKRLVEALNDSAKLYPWAAGEYHIPISVLEAPYDKERFYDIAAGLENSPEGGVRCAACFGLRLRQTYEAARQVGADYFGTTLTISPLKNAELINSIGMSIATEEGALWLPSDFKKREGYKHSIELSRIYGLYRQNYCGCEFSKLEARP